MTPEPPVAETTRYRWTVLVILTLVYTFNFIDRQILVILQEPIKLELGLSDAQLGLLTGFSFALVYVTAGIPIAWLADRSNRRNIVAASLAFWSLMTAFSGLVQNFAQLLAARLGVGIGEAGGSPPSHSMISDYFPPQHRGTALSFYSMGIYVGILFGYAAGGWIAESFGLQHGNLRWHPVRLRRRRLDCRKLWLARGLLPGGNSRYRVRASGFLDRQRTSTRAMG